MKRVKLFILILLLTLIMCEAKRKLRSPPNCEALCKKTGYHGKIGNCKCGFTIFTKRVFDDEETPRFARPYSSIASSSNRIYKKFQRGLNTILKLNSPLSSFK
ncbi:uncharacterized protein [Centruroides vittatus]|uniref:uncharacterized protein n=1 Tax=Centruroides vittatus TaxID=120091 RepID=UPI00351014C1